MLPLVQALAEALPRYLVRQLVNHRPEVVAPLGYIGDHHWRCSGFLGEIAPTPRLAPSVPDVLHTEFGNAGKGAERPHDSLGILLVHDPQQPQAGTNALCAAQTDQGTMLMGFVKAACHVGVPPGVPLPTTLAGLKVQVALSSGPSRRSGTINPPIIQGRGDILDKPSPQMQLYVALRRLSGWGHTGCPVRFEHQFPNMPLGQGEHIQTRVESVPLR